MSSGNAVAFVMVVLTAGREESVCQRSHDMVTPSPFHYQAFLGEGTHILGVLCPGASSGQT